MNYVDFLSHWVRLMSYVIVFVVCIAHFIKDTNRRCICMGNMIAAIALGYLVLYRTTFHVGAPYAQEIMSWGIGLWALFHIISLVKIKRKG